MDNSISIVTGTCNRKHHLKKLLGSIPSAVGDMDYEIIVTDGGSTDGTLEMLREDPRVKLIEHGELRGPVAAYNDAFAAASKDYVVYLTDDLELVRENVLAEAVRILESDKLIGIVSLPFVSSDSPDQKIVFSAISRPDGEYGTSFEIAPFGVLRRKDGDAVGWFSDWFYHYHGDSNLCISLAERGLHLYKLGHQAAYHYRLNNAVRGFAWEIPGAKQRSQHDGLILNILWGGYKGGEIQYGMDRRLAIMLKEHYHLASLIETGTYRGETSEWASGEFETVATIENDHKRYLRAFERIGHIGNLELIYGDSRKELKKIMHSQEYGRSLLWLDAHCRDWSGKRWEGEDQNPLKQELVTVSNNNMQHIIMIDDAWWIQQPPPFADYDPEQWPRLDEIKSILSNYDVLPRKGWNLLVAIPKSEKPTGRITDG